MKIISYKLFVIFFLASLLINAQKKIQQDYSREISVKKGTEVTLIADYADIEIKEWKKNRIRVDAVLTVDGVVNENLAKGYLSSWIIALTHEDDDVKIISKVNSHELYNFENFDFEMPEISIESLGVLDSMNFSFPKINFNEVFSDSTFNKIFTHDFNFKLDSLNGNFDISNFDRVKSSQEYLKKWQEVNKGNFVKLKEKALEMAKRNLEIQKRGLVYKNKMEKQQEKRLELLAKITEKRNKKLLEISEKRLELLAKITEKRNKKRLEISEKRFEHKKKREEKRLNIMKRRKEINKILKNRKETKLRTKLTIYVPKGTNFNMNVNYSKISTN